MDRKVKARATFGQALVEQPLDYTQATGDLKPTADVMEQCSGQECSEGPSKDFRVAFANQSADVFRCSDHEPVGIDRQKIAKGLDCPEDMNWLSIAVAQGDWGRRSRIHRLPTR